MQTTIYTLRGQLWSAVRPPLALVAGCVLLAVMSQGLAAAPKVFEVRQSGAKGDGKTLDTEAIQKALDQCGQAGGGIVRFKAGTYLSKPLTLSSDTTLELEAGAVLQATDGREDFLTQPEDSKSGFKAFISGHGLSNIVFRGKGIIDGAGARWWEPAEAARRKTPGYTLPRPRLIALNECTNIWLQDITLQNSPTFHFVPSSCQGVVVSNVTILAPAHSPNTDAIDPSATRDMLITHCLIDVGDDNVAIKAGHRVAGREVATQNITVTDCTFRHGHGMSIGSETPGGVSNVVVSRCVFVDTENGIRIKSPRGKGGLVQQVRYSDITMKDVTAALTITCYYPHIPDKDEPQALTRGTPMFRDISISNLVASTTGNAGVLVGLPESCISNVVLANVKIAAAQKGLLIRNAKAVELRQVQVNAPQGPAFEVQDAQVSGLPEQPDHSGR